MAVKTDADVIDIQSEEEELDVVVESEELIAPSRPPVEQKPSDILQGRVEGEKVTQGGKQEKTKSGAISRI